MIIDHIFPHMFFIDIYLYTICHRHPYEKHWAMAVSNIETAVSWAKFATW